MLSRVRTLATKTIYAHRAVLVLWKRGFAEAAEQAKTEQAGNRIKLSLTTPYRSLFKDRQVYLVTVPGSNGETGIMAKHVPTIGELLPGTVKIHPTPEIGKDVEKYFVSGGFFFVHPDSTLSVNAVEAIPLKDLDIETAKAELKKFSEEYSSATDPQVKNKAMIGMNLYDSMVKAMEAP